MSYNNRFSGAITIMPPLTRSQINDPRIARRTDVQLRIVEQKVDAEDGESFTVRPVADAIVPLGQEYSGHHLEDDIQLIVDTFPEHEYAGFIEAKWDPGFGEPPSRFIVKDDRVMRIDAQYRWPGIWPDEDEGPVGVPSQFVPQTPFSVTWDHDFLRLWCAFCTRFNGEPVEAFGGNPTDMSEIDEARRKHGAWHAEDH